MFRFLRYVCLSACLACVVESQFPLAAVMTLTSASDSLVLTVIILLRVFPGNGSIARGSVCCHDFWRRGVSDDVIMEFQFSRARYIL